MSSSMKRIGGLVGIQRVPAELCSCNSPSITADAGAKITAASQHSCNIPAAEQQFAHLAIDWYLAASPGGSQEMDAHTNAVFVLKCEFGWLLGQVVHGGAGRLVGLAGASAEALPMAIKQYGLPDGHGTGGSVPEARYAQDTAGSRHLLPARLVRSAPMPRRTRQSRRRSCVRPPDGR